MNKLNPKASDLTPGEPSAEDRKVAIDILNLKYRIKQLEELLSVSTQAKLNLVRELTEAKARAPAPALSVSNIERIIDIRLNDFLCEMKPDYDDAMTGFNEAWDIVRGVFAEHRAALDPARVPVPPLVGLSSAPKI